MYRAILRTLGFLAHAVSFVLAALFIIIFFGELIAPHSNASPAAVEWLGIILIAIACCVPALTVRHELRGALFSLAALGGFFLLADVSKWPVALVLALPGALHLVHALMERPGHPMNTAT